MKILKNICHKLGRCTKSKKIISSIILGFSTMLAFACTAFAADENPLVKAGLSGDNSPLSTLYHFFLAISIPMAVVGLILCFISFFVSGDKGRKIAQKRMLYIGIAIIVISIIPNLVSFVFDNPSIQSGGWKPEGGNLQIVESASNGVIDIHTWGPQPIENEEVEHSSSSGRVHGNSGGSLGDGAVVGNEGPLPLATPTPAPSLSFEGIDALVNP